MGLSENLSEKYFSPGVWVKVAVEVASSLGKRDPAGNLSGEEEEEGGHTLS